MKWYKFCYLRMSFGKRKMEKKVSLLLLLLSYKLSWADVSSIMRNLRRVKKEKKFSKRKKGKEAELITCLVKAMNLGSWGQS